jgi:hypothetical protein
MQRFLIFVANSVLLAALLCAPTVAGVQLWHWQVSSIAGMQMLVRWGLILAAVLNSVAALLWKGRAERQSCRLWAAVFGASALAYWVLTRGGVHWDWLRSALLWLQHHLGGGN